MRKAIAALAGANLIVALAVCGALPGSTLGQAPSLKRQALLDSTVRFLQDSQQQDGSFAQAGEPTQGTSAWVALALAAAGINPRNQAKPCGTDAYTYLVTHFHGEAGPSKAPVATTALERELLVVNASGGNPHDFAGFDLVAELLGRQLPDGSFAFLPEGKGQANATIFAILALSPVDEASIEPAIRSAVEWLISQQGKDGGWSWLDKGTISEVDMTGAAIEALNAAGPPSVAAERAAFESAQQEALEYLEDAQLPDGGFPALPGSQSESNVASTAWAVQGIWSAGGNPEAWRTGSGLLTEEPLDYMESMQQPDGQIRWSRSSDLNGIWMTAYVTPAFAGQALPIPEATFSNASVPSCETNGDGKETGVIAGGGGKGAPLFSRPKPQSKGKTPGGARIVRNKGLRPRNHSRSRRGASTKQPTGTETAEPKETNAADQDEVTAVSSSAGPGESGRPGGPGAAGAEAGAGPGAGPAGAPVPATLREAVEDAAAGAAGREVSGVVIGDVSAAGDSELAFGAPGLRSADEGGDPERWVAIGIGAAALLVALSGAQWERRREEALP
jgi:Prenyltransferase and squalene oxidase repeat